MTTVELTNKQKGDLLEEAVANVESTILRNFVNSRTSRIVFHLEPGKRSKHKGIGDEADLVATVFEPNGRSSVILFECKNWKKAVTKNEVIILADKIRVHKATKGFLVARKFNSGAKLKAIQYRKIRLVIFDDNLDKIIKEISISQTSKILTSNVRVVLKGSNAQVELLPTDVIEVKTTASKSPANALMDFYLSPRYGRQAIYDAGYKSLKLGTVPFDLRFPFEDRFEFKGGEYDQFVVELTGQLHVANVQLISRFDIESRGRYSTLEFVDENGVSCKIEKTNLPKNDQTNFSIGNDIFPGMNIQISIEPKND